MSLYDQIEKSFTYHPPRDEAEIRAYQDIRASAKTLALIIDEIVPDSREKSLAITALEQVVFWSNAGVARHGLEEPF